MKSKLLITLLAALGLTVGFSAVAAPTTFATDANHTFAQFEYSHLGFSTQTSRFNTVSGTVTIDQAAKKGSADITIDTKSVDTGSTFFNKHIQDEDFLATTQFPTATFQSDDMIFKGDKPVALKGTLTLKGVSKPVTLKITHFECKKHPMTGADYCGANAETQVKRTEFNMGKYAPNVGDQVTILIAIEAAKKE
ncbi:Polyisoprenoid-binding protein YceI [Polynucleobacter meluiroseus]|uniref:Polyisoprenoid-binding protein YceI n=1 Tax=Polynucleobacter meluiroseus TaxID=1938814 RepID=A0A240DXX1_9BURK|nr:YceI family protein [Polynucleobacter meluiroseus]SNX28048.1 Polyisoprenoid-binding protein YceI [Polynucleobacter meluiroseus]